MPDPSSDSTRRGSGPTNPAEASATPTHTFAPLTDASAGSTSADAAPLDEQAPAHLGKYLLVRKLGQGGMGVVFQAVDPDLDRVVALKTIRSGIFADDEEVHRFYNEARAVAQFRHPNIVQIYEIDQDQGQHYFTMAYAAGETLSRRHAEFRERGPKAASLLVEKIARAVHFAHERKLLHRDLKPANILLDEQGEPLVSDFGLVKFLDEDQDTTQTGQAVGTLPYMSPEQVAGQRERVSAATDVWALGVILFELLTGQRPFSGKSKQETSNAIIQRPVPSLRKINPKLDRDLETIVSRCLEKEPDHRYKSALELADDLRVWREEQPIKARPWPWHVRLGRTVRRHPLAVAAAVVAILGAAIVVPYLMPVDPDAWEKGIQRDLLAGKAVTLIGQTGAPAGYRWAVKEKAGDAAADRDQPFRVNAAELNMLELLSDPAIASYRFEAEILHELDRRGNTIGLYVGDRDHGAAKARSFVKIQFNDAVDDRQRFGLLAKEIVLPPEARITSPLPKGNPAYVETVLFGEGLDRNLFASARHHFVHDKGRWRRLAVQVTSRRFAVTFDGAPVGDWSWDEINRASAKRFVRDQALLGKRLEGIAPTFSGRGGLGLFLVDSVALFRNVSITPIPDDAP